MRWFTLHCWAVLTCTAVLSGCAHRDLRVSGPEMERASVELASRGKADVRTDEGIVTTIRADERVATPSGEMRADRWIGTNCDPSGICHFDRESIAIQRVDRGASARR